MHKISHCESVETSIMDESLTESASTVLVSSEIQWVVWEQHMQCFTFSDELPLPMSLFFDSCKLTHRNFMFYGRSCVTSQLCLGKVQQDKLQNHSHNYNFCSRLPTSWASTIVWISFTCTVHYCLLKIVFWHLAGEKMVPIQIVLACFVSYDKLNHVVNLHVCLMTVIKWEI